MALSAARTTQSPVRVELADLVRLRAAGEALTLTAPRVRVVTAGGHLSPYKGRGVEYDESRPYQAGDDLRTIDWRVTARTGKPHTKVFREERNRPVFVWLDLRRPMMFATRGEFKAVRAAELAALIAWSAVAHGDRLGGLVFSESDHQELRPALGARAALRLLRAVCADSFWLPPLETASVEIDAERALQRLARVARPGSQIFLLSDFRRLGADAERNLRRLAGHCDLLLVNVFDAVEAELPPPGRYRIQSAGRSFSIDTTDEGSRRRYHERFEARRALLKSLARTPGIRALDCATDADPRSVLAQQFRPR
ncbi:MAG TPA: DUF58 domain-containing protein [Gammaproteobacteria bacterium]|nr:DUF58 domain-containing protein [Gammaproteobacteria bacterium]